MPRSRMLRATSPVLLTAMACTAAAEPRPAPASATIVLALEIDGNRDIYRVHPDGSALTRLTTDPADDDLPSASRSSVVFVSARDGGSTLYAVPLAGGEDSRAPDAPAGARDPALSPDGARLAFITTTLGTARLTIADADGSNARTVPPTDAAAVDASPAWRADGTALAWTTTAASSADVVRADLAATDHRTAVTVDAAADVEPAWSPGGREIAFVSTRDGDQAVYVVRLASGATHRVSPAGLAAASPTWLSDDEIVYVARAESALPTLRRQIADGLTPPTLIPLPASAIPSHPRAVPAP